MEHPQAEDMERHLLLEEEGTEHLQADTAHHLREDPQYDAHYLVLCR
jgi:hypothetical protein